MLQYFSAGDGLATRRNCCGYESHGGGRDLHPAQHGQKDQESETWMARAPETKPAVGGCKIGSRNSKIW